MKEWSGAIFLCSIELRLSLNFWLKVFNFFFFLHNNYPTTYLVNYGFMEK